MAEVEAKDVSSLKILWVHDDNNGPVTGLAQYGNEKVWFSHISQAVCPPVVSSTDVPVPNDQEIEERSYFLMRLSPEVLNMVESDHMIYCNTTGAPIYHGDPFKVKKTLQIKKMDIAAAIPQGQDYVEATLRPLANVKSHNRLFDSGNISGKIIATVKSSDFGNYYVPRRIEMD